MDDRLDPLKVQEGQKAMDQWGEGNDPDSPYEVVKGMLYSIKKPYQYAPEYHRLVLPSSFRQEVISKAHKQVGHMAHVKTMRKEQEAYMFGQE